MVSKSRLNQLKRLYKATKPISLRTLSREEERIGYNARTKKQATKELNDYKRFKSFARTRVDNYPYYLYKIRDDRGKVKAMAEPFTKGAVVFSGEDWSSYRMTHGGSIFREVARLLDKIAGQ